MLNAVTSLSISSLLQQLNVSPNIHLRLWVQETQHLQFPSTNSCQTQLLRVFFIFKDSIFFLLLQQTHNPKQISDPKPFSPPAPPPLPKQSRHLKLQRNQLQVRINHKPTSNDLVGNSSSDRVENREAATQVATFSAAHSKKKKKTKVKTQSKGMNQQILVGLFSCCSCYFWFTPTVINKTFQLHPKLDYNSW